jgi:hypothetical protein
MPFREGILPPKVRVNADFFVKSTLDSKGIVLHEAAESISADLKIMVHGRETYRS